MKSKVRQQSKSNSYFWRACGYLKPYRPLVITSIVCALFVGAAFAGGLGSLAPIMHLFLNGDTIQTWADREIVQRRIGVTFTEQTHDLQIVRVQPDGPAARTGLRIGDELSSRSAPGEPDGFAQTLAQLSDPALTSATVEVLDKGVPRMTATLVLPPEPVYVAIARGVVARAPTNPVKAVAVILGVMLTLAVFSNVLSFIQEYLSDKAAILAVNDIRRRLYDHVLHVPLSHFGLKGTSDVTSRLTQDAQSLNEGFKTVLGQSIQEPIKALAAFILALVVSWKLTMFIVVFGPLMLLVIKKFGKKMRRASKKALLSSSTMLGQIEGSLLGIRVVKGASAERFERRRYTRIMDKLIGEQLRMSRIDAFTAPTMGTLTLLVVGIIVLFASYMVLVSHSLAQAQFIWVMACLSTIADSLRRVSKVNNVLQRSNAAAARIFEVLDLPMERNRRLSNADVRLPIAQSLPRVKLPPLAREIRFEGVTFSYPNASQPALVEVDLAVPKGKSLAIVGRNGSGKTTLLSLLPRFYDPQRGRILIDDVDIRSATLRSLRGQISIVTQDSVIFPGTIAQNIAYGNPLATLPQIEEAAQGAFAHEFILEKPRGYQELLGELGGQLSGGQKQRLCIARAILRSAPILVFDEATSQVDAESEELIQAAIKSLMKHRTTFVIAHRLGTILSADEIVVMDRGRIVGHGNHAELMETCNTYQQLYERQLFAPPAAREQMAEAPVA